MLSILGVLVYLVVVAIGAFALFWIIRLGVRFGLRDHARWVDARPERAPE
jgi:hypothetical protein